MATKYIYYCRTFTTPKYSIVRMSGSRPFISGAELRAACPVRALRVYNALVLWLYWSQYFVERGETKWRNKLPLSLTLWRATSAVLFPHFIESWAARYGNQYRQIFPTYLCVDRSYLACKIVVESFNIYTEIIKMKDGLTKIVRSQSILGVRVSLNPKNTQLLKYIEMKLFGVPSKGPSIVKR